jgi:ribosomal protein L40E
MPVFAYILVYLAVHIPMAIVFWRAAERRGRNGGNWCVVGLLGPLAWLIGYLVLAKDYERQLANEIEQSRNDGIECLACGSPNAPSETECRKCHQPMRQAVGAAI